MADSEERPLAIVIISGGTGRTANHVVNSVLAQFDSPDVRIVRKTDVRTSRAAIEIVQTMAGERCVICHSLVTPKVREALLAEAKKCMIPTVDILGQMLAILADNLGIVPHFQPGLAYKLQKDYFDRMDAVSFTLDHDDGAGPATLHKADVVLVGVSRVSKSVTCFYLAYRGIRAANVPLISGIDPPKQLLKLPKTKVIGLTVNPNRLQNVRQARKQAIGDGPLDYYVDRRDINQELRYATDLMNQNKWQCIDVSYMAVEEVAVEVLKMIGMRG